MPDLKRHLAIRPSYTRQISDQSQMEMASPLSTIPPPSVLDAFERAPPVRTNTLPVVVSGRVWNLPKPMVNAASTVSHAAAKAKPFWREGLAGICLAAITAWLIALTVKLSQANTDIDALYNMPFCEDMPATTGQGILPVKFP